MWDKNRPTRIIPRAEVYTSGDVTVEELRGENDEPRLTAEALAERLGEPARSDDEDEPFVADGDRRGRLQEPLRCGADSLPLPRSSPMLLAVDVGNTQTVLGLYDGERLSEHWRLATERTRTGDELGVLLGGLLDLDVGRRDLPLVDRARPRPRVGAARRRAGRTRRCSSSARASRPASRSATTTRARSVPTGSSTPSPPRRATARP